MNFERIIENPSEPQWLKILRKENLDLFYKHPFPKWKRVDISTLKLEELDFSFKIKKADYLNENGFILIDSNPLEKTFKNEYLFFSDLLTALQIEPELMKEFLLNSLLKGEEGKFQALANALWKNGFFLHLKKGTKLKEPIKGVHLSVEDKTLITRTIIFAEEDTEFTFIEDFSSDKREEGHLKISILEVHLQEGASGKVITLNRRKTDGWDFHFKKALLRKGSRLSDYTVELGRGNAIGNFSVELNEENSEIDFNSVIAVNNNQKFDLLYEVIHSAKNTKSKIFSRGIVGNQGKGVWRGLTHVKKGANGSSVSQRGEILLTGMEAKADAIPSLWIDENDCSASHGASVFPISPEKIFYLESKGVEPFSAEILIGKGFLMSVLKDLNINKEEIEKLIESKLGFQRS